MDTYKCRTIQVCLWTVAVVSAAYAGPKDEALAAYDQFYAAFTTDNQDEIVKLFAPDAQFYGTGSRELVTAPEGVRQYFANALASKNGAVKARPFDRSALALSDAVVLISGTWQAERTVDGTMTTGGPLRNSVVMHKRDGRWVIAQFHNSAMPKPPAQPAPPINGR